MSVTTVRDRGDRPSGQEEPRRAYDSGMRSYGHRILAAALALGCGCSLIAVRRPPPSPVAPDAPLECTQSRVAPALDTAGAVATPIVGFTMWGLCSFVSAMQSWSSDPTRLKCSQLLWGTVFSTAAYTGSAVYGYHATGDCRRLAEQRRAAGVLDRATPSTVGGVDATTGEPLPPDPPRK